MVDTPIASPSANLPHEVRWPTGCSSGGTDWVGRRVSRPPPESPHRSSPAVVALRASALAMGRTTEIPVSGICRQTDSDTTLAHSWTTTN